MLKPIYLPRSGSDTLWERLRIVRNGCVDGLTGEVKETSPEQQATYRRSYSEDTRHYLYLNADGLVVAYSRLAWVDGYVIPSCGVAPGHRGKGYSWDVVRHLLAAAGGPLRGHLRADNAPIVRVDFFFGFRSTGPEIDGIIPVECAWPPDFMREGYSWPSW